MFDWKKLCVSKLIGAVFFAGFLTTAFGDFAYAQEYPAPKGKHPAFGEVIENPDLPRVLIIGDSISIGYTPALRKLLHGKVNVYRVRTNCGPTTRGVAQIEQWLAGRKYDVIHFNWGLHDLKFVDKNLRNIAPEKGVYQVPLKQYEANLKKLVARLKKTEAKLIWRNTTPVPQGCRWRIASDEMAYNKVAAKIMKENGIPIDDHHQYVLKRQSKIQRPADVHFTSKGSSELAQLATKAILDSLGE